MKTIVDLPDPLVAKLKLRAVQEGREVEDVIAELVAAGVSETSDMNGQDVLKTLPMIEARPANTHVKNELSTQEWCDLIKGADLQLEVERHEKALGHQHVDRSDS